MLNYKESNKLLRKVGNVHYFTRSYIFHTHFHKNGIMKNNIFLWQTEHFAFLKNENIGNAELLKWKQGHIMFN